jgi:hypothetical protein
MRGHSLLTSHSLKQFPTSHQDRERNVLEKAFIKAKYVPRRD